MKVVLDEMLPAAVAGLLSGHDVATAKAAGYMGLSNGDLIRRAAADGYDVLVTADRNLPAQQNVPASRLAVVLVRGSRMVDVDRRRHGFGRQWPNRGQERSRESCPTEVEVPRFGHRASFRVGGNARRLVRSRHKYAV